MGAERSKTAPLFVVSGFCIFRSKKNMIVLKCRKKVFCFLAVF